MEYPIIIITSGPGASPINQEGLRDIIQYPDWFIKYPSFWD